MKFDCVYILNHMLYQLKNMMCKDYDGEFKYRLKFKFNYYIYMVQYYKVNQKSNFFNFIDIINYRLVNNLCNVRESLT